MRGQNMKQLIAANWKMHKTAEEAGKTARQLLNCVPAAPTGTEIVIFPPFTAIEAVKAAVQGKADFSVGAQNMYPAQEGAFTGEISPAMLLAAGCVYVLAGHSERRHIFGESNELIGQKVALALCTGLRAVLCIGETLAQREAGELADTLHLQLLTGLKDLPPACNPAEIVIAYEPVWAIGTGKVAGPDEIVQAHALVRKYLKEFLPQHSSEVRILYGGSVKAENAAEIKKLDNVDGLLVGGASLQAENFSKIITA